MVTADSVLAGIQGATPVKYPHVRSISHHY